MRFLKATVPPVTIPITRSPRPKLNRHQSCSRFLPVASTYLPFPTHAYAHINIHHFRPSPILTPSSRTHLRQAAAAYHALTYSLRARPWQRCRSGARYCSWILHRSLTSTRATSSTYTGCGQVREEAAHVRRPADVLTLCSAQVSQSVPTCCRKASATRT